MHCVRLSLKNCRRLIIWLMRTFVLTNAAVSILVKYFVYSLDIYFYFFPAYDLFATSFYIEVSIVFAI